MGNCGLLLSESLNQLAAERPPGCETSQDIAGEYTVAKKRPKTNPSEANTSQTPSFEEALGRLEEIVHLLEEGDLGLTEALARYEEGVRLLRQSYDLLQHAERRIELLGGVDAEGNPTVQPLEDRATLSPDEETGQQRPASHTSAEGVAGGRSGQSPPDDTDMDAPEGLF